MEKLPRGLEIKRKLVSIDLDKTAKVEKEIEQLETAPRTPAAQNSLAKSPKLLPRVINFRGDEQAQSSTAMRYK
jgi:hypothetical protein